MFLWQGVAGATAAGGVLANAKAEDFVNKVNLPIIAVYLKYIRYGRLQQKRQAGAG